MKRNYQKPAMRVVELKHKYSILQASNYRVTSVRGNVFEDIESDENYNGDVR
jgi:hypothetical protein